MIPFILLTGSIPSLLFSYTTFPVFESALIVFFFFIFYLPSTFHNSSFLLLIRVPHISLILTFLYSYFFCELSIILCNFPASWLLHSFIIQFDTPSGPSTFLYLVFPSVVLLLVRLLVCFPLNFPLL